MKLTQRNKLPFPFAMPKMPKQTSLNILICDLYVSGDVHTQASCPFYSGNTHIHTHTHTTFCRRWYVYCLLLRVYSCAYVNIILEGGHETTLAMPCLRSSTGASTTFSGKFCQMSIADNRLEKSCTLRLTKAAEHKSNHLTMLSAILTLFHLLLSLWGRKNQRHDFLNISQHFSTY